MGNGKDFANASMYTTKDSKMKPKERIIKALECAEKFAIGVQRPFYLINSKDDEVIEIT